MNIRPLHDKVVVKRFEAEERTPGGIVIPDAAREKPRKGKVLAVGPGRRNDQGVLVPMGVKEGDVVLFTAYAGSEVELDKEKLVVLGESDILAIVS